MQQATLYLKTSQLRQQALDKSWKILSQKSSAY